jgi:hypothetical protein
MVSYRAKKYIALLSTIQIRSLLQNKHNNGILSSHKIYRTAVSNTNPFIVVKKAQQWYLIEPQNVSHCCQQYKL